MADVNCKSCRFYSQNGNVLGLCRRFPEYQHKSENEWCGEFVAKMLALPVIDPPQTNITLVLPKNTATAEVKRRGRPKKEVQNV